MARLNLVIADSEENYVKSLLSYISINHSATFMVSCFTKHESFNKYIEQQPLFDIILISPDFYELSTRLPNVKLKIILSPGTLNRDYIGFQIINKYCTGEKLIGDIIHLYSKLDPLEQRVSACLKNTSLVGVYSPAGGTGKTTIAASLSLMSNEMGMNAFYLNLESIQSTGVLFDSKVKRNLSYVFFYVKEKSKNLSFRMEGIKDTDTDSGVQYFSPPESPLEYEEIDADELEQLLRGIRDMGCYNYIYIDMSSSFDRKNYKVLKMCDCIVQVILDDPIAMHKDNIFYNELIKLSDMEKGSITEKLIPVINKCKSGAEGIYEFAEKTQDVIRIPEFPKTLVNGVGRNALGDEGFNKAISRLVEIISAK